MSLQALVSEAIPSGMQGRLPRARWTRNDRRSDEVSVNHDLQNLLFCAAGGGVVGDK